LDERLVAIGQARHEVPGGRLAPLSRPAGLAQAKCRSAHQYGSGSGAGASVPVEWDVNRLVTGNPSNCNEFVTE
jgi:hypothetical protein